MGIETIFLLAYLPVGFLFLNALEHQFVFTNTKTGERYDSLPPPMAATVILLYPVLGLALTVLLVWGCLGILWDRTRPNRKEIHVD